MGYKLRLDETVAHGLRRLARKQAHAIRKVLIQKSTPSDSAIHEARKSLKKLRVIARLVGQHHGTRMRSSTRTLKRVNRTLSRLRDASGIVEILEKIARTHPRVLAEPTLIRVRQALRARRNRLFREAAAEGAWKKMRQTLTALEHEVRTWKPRHREFKAVSKGIRDAHHDGRLARRAARSSERAEDFHELRKSIKTLWYETRLLEPLGAVVRKQVTSLDHAQAWLGDDHSMSVLLDVLDRQQLPGLPPGELEQLRSTAARLQQQLRRKALAQVRAVYAVAPKRYVGRLERTWHAARARG